MLITDTDLLKCKSKDSDLAFFFWPNGLKKTFVSSLLVGFE